jgi:hypothetical protein
VVTVLPVKSYTVGSSRWRGIVGWLWGRRLS